MKDKEEINEKLNKILEDNKIDNPAIRAFVMVEIDELFDLAYQQGKADRDNDWKNLITHLYFVEGLEDLRSIPLLKRKYLIEWSKNQGERLCQIIFALSMGKDPVEIGDDLKQELNKAKG